MRRLFFLLLTQVSQTQINHIRVITILDYSKLTELLGKLGKMGRRNTLDIEIIMYKIQQTLVFLIIVN